MIAKPLMQGPVSTPPLYPVIWWTRWEDRFQIEMVALTNYQCDLLIFDRQVLIYAETMDLSDDVQEFVPAVDDIARCEEIAEGVIKTYKALER